MSFIITDFDLFLFLFCESKLLLINALQVKELQATSHSLSDSGIQDGDSGASSFLQCGQETPSFGADSRSSESTGPLLTPEGGLNISGAIPKVG